MLKYAEPFFQEMTMVKTKQTGTVSENKHVACVLSQKTPGPSKPPSKAQKALGVFLHDVGSKKDT